MKKYIVILQRIKKEPPYNLMIPLLGVHPQELKTVTQEDIYILKFIAALFIIAKR